jgi:DNA-directed RNA polymerase subunit beta'
LDKDTIMTEGDRKTLEIEDQYKEGLLTKKERYNSIIRVWSDVKDQLQKTSKDSLDKEGAVFSMIDSGARGSVGQLTNVVGMKGLVSSPSGEIIELPIKSSFREGLDVLEYFISSHGTRKGLTDTALRTANAGYLTRRLVDVSQDVIIMAEDCGDTDGVVLTAAECEEIGEPLLTRLHGRVLMKDIKDPASKDTLVKKGKLVDENDIRGLQGKEIESAHVRSLLTCKLKRGLCQKCYGTDLAYNQLVKLGTAVGIIAAQSIGEPGTQLTMRTFHSGGVAAADITQGLPRVEELFEARTPKRKALFAEVSGMAKIVEGERRILQTAKGEKLVDTTSGTRTFIKKDQLKVEDGSKVKEGQMLIIRSTGEEVIASHPGTIRIEKNKLHHIFEGASVLEQEVPAGYSILIKDGQEVTMGDVLTEGQYDLQELFRLRGTDAVMRYLLREVLAIYASQGQKLNAKHIEVIVRQMFSRVYVKDAGETELLPGQIVDRYRAEEENEQLGTKGKVTQADLQPLFMGITKVALSTESFLSAASFMETARVLINAAVTGKIDRLEGLKENVIIGRLTPAGTGFGVNPAELEREYEKNAGTVSPSA